MDDRSQTMETLLCSLTDSEWRDRSSELGRKIAELRKQQEVMKELAAAEKKKEKDLQKEVDTLGRSVDTKTEERPVLCMVLPNIVKKEMEIIRTDTKELVRTRPMSLDEIKEHTQLAFGGVRDRTGEDN